nr:reverse transcriptase domain-containing protein [Tanacetum cinerariifolium]
TDDDSFSFDNIDYVEASPPDSELVSSEVMEIVIPEVGGIKASNDNPIPSYDPIISGTPPNLTPSGESEFFLKVDAFLAVVDESTSSQIPKSDLDPEGDMLLFESFLNDDPSSESQTKSSSTSLNSLLEETNNFHNSLPECTTFSHDSDSLMEENDLFCTPDYLMPPGIEDEDYDSERDILIPKDLPSNNSLSFAEKVSVYFDIPLFSRPPAKPPDG